MISGMSFGAVSKNVRLILAKVASNLEIGSNAGEDLLFYLKRAGIIIKTTYCPVFNGEVWNHFRDSNEEFGGGN